MIERLLVACLLLVAWCRVAGAMEVGTNFWDVGWGGERNDPFVDGWSYADGSTFRIIGLGTEWAKRRTTKDKDGSEQNENVVVVPGANGWLGAHPTFFSVGQHGSGVVSMNTDDVYLGRVDPKAGPPVGAKIVGEKYVDLGIRGLRSYAVDHSGHSGAPGLFVVVDRISGSKQQPVWQMHTGAESIKADGNAFTITAKDGATLVGTFVAPARAKLQVHRRSLLVTGGDEFFVVMTVQRDAAPEVDASGSALGARVKVGEQEIRFDGEKIVLKP